MSKLNGFFSKASRKLKNYGSRAAYELKDDFKSGRGEGRVLFYGGAVAGIAIALPPLAIAVPAALVGFFGGGIVGQAAFDKIKSHRAQKKTQKAPKS